MCNPRRIRVHATRELAEAWEQEVRRHVTLSGRATADARIRESLADSIGGPVLTALTNVLSRLDDWSESADGTFWQELDGGRITFDPAARELEIVATASAEVSVTEEAATTVTTEVSKTVEAEGEGVYFDDGWGGLNADTAQRDAERNLAVAMEEALRRDRDRARQDTDTTVGESVQREAAARAEAALDEASSARADELRQAATERLMAVGTQGRALFHVALAEAYRDAILAYALSRRAGNLRQSEQDGMLDIEFELNI